MIAPARLSRQANGYTEMVDRRCDGSPRARRPALLTACDECGNVKSCGFCVTLSAGTIAQANTGPRFRGELALVHKQTS
ncbi:hypothetical protein FTUN_2224 [Frigoriglobus tundricola]|uniref:Uncharacterized protein n=1 Tax=Frigoriglobus tundricola TaxID=2774151 RepID=A0A6M5YNZ9_9BACT|nr:hypothetical protein FTUN_2224 [Frigoriglobus tundricola]